MCYAYMNQKLMDFSFNCHKNIVTFLISLLCARCSVLATLHILCVHCICYMAACSRMVCIIVMSNGAGGCRHALFYSVIRFYCFSIDAFKLHSMLESSSTNHFKFKKENNHVDYSSFHYNM